MHPTSLNVHKNAQHLQIVGELKVRVIYLQELDLTVTSTRRSQLIVLGNQQVLYVCIVFGKNIWNVVANLEQDAIVERVPGKKLK